jgi:hypothetical protein
MVYMQGVKKNKIKPGRHMLRFYNQDDPEEEMKQMI